MKKSELRIGLALSGGGMRAAVFHLGILKWMAEHQLLKQVAHTSTVSGASLCMGLIYACNGNQWPQDSTFLERVLPVIEQRITGIDLQWHALLRLLMQPYYWGKKANLLANVMEKRWGIQGTMQNISKKPMWTVNTTCFETGKDFRISLSRMGEHDSSYVMHPAFKVSHAMAASAGFPVLIGPYKLKTHRYTWVDASGTITVRPRDEILHLWDGGVYDNMGLDPLFLIDNDGELSSDINYLIVSNACGTIDHKKRKLTMPVENLKRMLDISQNQVESLKSRSVKDYIQRKQNGLYIRIGDTVEDILKSMVTPDAQQLRQKAMNSVSVARAAEYKITLEKMPTEDYHRILWHGYELMEASWMRYACVDV